MLLIIAILLALFVLPEAIGPPVVMIALIIEVAEVFFWIRFSRRGSPRAGAQALIGREARVIEDCRPIGRIWLDGEAWRARCDEGAAVGELVRVRALEGLTVHVGRTASGARDEGSDPGPYSDGTDRSGA